MPEAEIANHLSPITAVPAPARTRVAS